MKKILDGKIIDMTNEENEILNNERIDYENINGPIYKLNKINSDFNEEIKAFNSSYPIEEQKRFADKLAKAEKVIAGGADNYISQKASFLGITALQFAEKIKAKSELFEKFYIKAENARDSLISNL